MDAGAFSYGVFTDFKKAYDTVDHSIPIHKLDLYDFRGIINVWFRSYLQDRTQITVIDRRPLLSRLTKQSRKGSFPFPTISLVNWMSAFCPFKFS